MRIQNFIRLLLRLLLENRLISLISRRPGLLIISTLLKTVINSHVIRVPAQLLKIWMELIPLLPTAHLLGTEVSIHIIAPQSGFPDSLVNLSFIHGSRIFPFLFNDFIEKLCFLLY